MRSLEAYIMHHAGAKTALFLSMLAGDGNPVRHSLVNLVLEEDLPMLMEAMSEECNVVFDDYTDSTTASTSSIIHAPNERRERRRQRNVDHRG
uniref:DH domain-containing protein n=1 Tax=Steinernema glaseri TaxID=37863 RepID=A0A1I7Y156_9BILA